MSNTTNHVAQAQARQERLAALIGDAQPATSATAVDASGPHIEAAMGRRDRLAARMTEEG
jgi:hypothetical protein